MPKAAAAAATLVGIVLVLGSCVPLGLSIYASAWATPVLAASLALDQPLRSEAIRVTPGQLVRIAVKARIETPSVQEEKKDEKAATYKARYRFPVVFSVFDTAGSRLAERREAVAWDTQAMTVTDDERATSVGGSLTVKHTFEGIEAPASGAIVVEASMAPDRQYLARASDVQLLVYDNQGSDRKRVALFMAMLVGGGLLAVVGIIFLASSMAGAPSSPGVASSPAGESAVPAASRKRAAACHALGFLGYLVPFGNLFGPLAMWLYWRSADPYVDRQGKEAVNFQLSVVVYMMASVILILVLIGAFLIFAVALLHFIFMVAAAASAAGGKDFRYPMTVRFVK
jgi:uncharacterized Tic20 family protein